MCDRYTFTLPAEALADIFGVPPPAYTIEGSHDLTPGQCIVLVRSERGRRVADVAFWGLIPGWVKDPNAFPKPFEARAETLEEKATFRTAFKRKRVLVPASGFYAWKTEGKARQRFYIRPAAGDGFAFAGLMEDWQGPNGEVMVSACLITTASDGPMADIHPRMPAILPPASWDLWLDPAAQTREVRPLLKPYPGERLVAHPVDQPPDGD